MKRALIRKNKIYFAWPNTGLRKCFTFDVSFSTDLSIHPLVANGWGHVDHWAAERETSWQSTGGGGRGDKVNTDTILQYQPWHQLQSITSWPWLTCQVWGKFLLKYSSHDSVHLFSIRLLCEQASTKLVSRDWKLPTLHLKDDFLPNYLLLQILDLFVFLLLAVCDFRDLTLRLAWAAKPPWHGQLVWSEFSNLPFKIS